MSKYYRSFAWKAHTLMLIVPSVTTIAYPSTPREIFAVCRPGVVKRHNNHGGLDTFERCLVGRRCVDEPSARLAQHSLFNRVRPT